MPRKPGAHRPSLLLGTGDQHPPAVQRTVFPPRVFRAVVDTLAEGDHQRTLQVGIQFAEGTQGGVVGALQARGAVDRHRHGCGGGDAAVTEFHGDFRQVQGRGLQHQGLRGLGKLIPVDVSTGDVRFGVG